MSLRINSDFNGVTDPDAGAYIAAVEAADGQLLEFAVGKAINDFVIGCKADGIWDAIKATCILAGARTTNGALIPLKGAAPTPVNFDLVNNTDYNRKNGITGTNGYLDSNRAGNLDPQNNSHLALFQASGTFSIISGNRNGASGARGIDTFGSGLRPRTTSISAADDRTVTPSAGLIGWSRTGSTSGTIRGFGVTTSITTTSETPQSDSLLIFKRRNASTGTAESGSSGQCCFYSIGESLDLAKLDSRVTDLITAFGAAIP